MKNLYKILAAFVVLALFFACEKSSSVPVPKPVDEGFAKGADVSWITEMEAAGKKFYNVNDRFSL